MAYPPNGFGQNFPQIPGPYDTPPMNPYGPPGQVPPPSMYGYNGPPMMEYSPVYPSNPAPPPPIGFSQPPGYPPAPYSNSPMPYSPAGHPGYMNQNMNQNMNQYPPQQGMNQIQEYHGNGYSNGNGQQNEYDDRGQGGHGGMLGKFSKVIGGVLGNSDGIRQLLNTATAHAVRILGSTNGYFSHAVAKILLPPKLDILANFAQKLHLSSYIEKFVLSMNRAAEQAATSALPVFQRFISSLSLNDAASLVGAKDTEATDFFRQSVERDLEQAYTPIVAESMNNHQVTRQFQELQSQTRNIPGLRHLNVDIHEYTIKKALSGLFWVVGEQEKKIRQDPGGQVSNVFQKFFKH